MKCFCPLVFIPFVSVFVSVHVVGDLVFNFYHVFISLALQQFCLFEMPKLYVRDAIALADRCNAIDDVEYVLLYNTLLNSDRLIG